MWLHHAHVRTTKNCLVVIFHVSLYHGKFKNVEIGSESTLQTIPLLTNMAAVGTAAFQLHRARGYHVREFTSRE